MTSLINDRLCQTLQGQITDRPPIWLMRQAGRYLPEYQVIRRRVPDFMTRCKQPDLVTEITLQPLERFDLDAAIIFSDILTIPEAMGLGLRFIPGQGPVFERPITSPEAIQALPQDVLSDLTYVFDAIQTTQAALNKRVPLIGFSGSPWTLSAYMIEGQSSPSFSKALQLSQQHPQAMHQLLACLTQHVVAYCSAQIDAGADVIMIFDSWGGRLPDDLYSSISLDYLNKIVSELTLKHPNIPTIVYSKVSFPRVQQLMSIPCMAIGLSHEVDLNKVRAQYPDRVLQGNINPDCMSASDPQQVIDETLKCLKAHGDGPAIINLGHGIKPDAQIDHVHTLIETVHQYAAARA
ncbi:MAG: uroporphyrinogen decarboxylase [Legionellales bacterium]|nr:uroporphyrinogen decarboxylase [Legionellales bacterium]